MVIDNSSENVLHSLLQLGSFHRGMRHIRGLVKGSDNSLQERPILCFPLCLNSITQPHPGPQLLPLIKSVGNCVNIPLGHWCSSLRMLEN